MAILGLRIEALHAEIAQIEQTVKALEIAIETLEACIAEFHDHCLGGVTDDTSHFLKTITGGRYERVHLDPGSLIPIVDMPGHPGITHDLLSRGVMDQLYFSLRIALSKALSGGRTLPLVLDDPFVNFDPERLERAIALLRDIVQRTQMILFTCDPQYLQWLEPVKVLRRPDTLPIDLPNVPGVA